MNSAYQSDKIDLITQDLIKAHAEISHAVKDKSNPHFKSEFASLEAVIDATKDAYLKHGCIIMQMPAVIDDRNMLVTQIMHGSGQWIRSFTPILAKDISDPQKFGSGLTYARRYAMAAMSNVGQSDDDGNHAASGKQATIWPFPVPTGAKGVALEDMSVDELSSCAKSLVEWQSKTEKGQAKVAYPKERGDQLLNQIKSMLKGEVKS